MNGPNWLIWHIFRKDAQLLWPLAAAVAASHALVAVLTFGCHCGAGGPSGFISAIAGVLSLGYVIGSIALIIGIVQQDPLPGDDQDWLTRPIRRSDLIASKLLAVLILFGGPQFLIDVLVGLAHRFPLTDILETAVAHSVTASLLLGLPLVAAAATTRSLGQVFAVIAACAASAIAFFLLWMLFRGDPPDFSASGINWVIAQLVLLLIVGGCGAVVLLQYLRRRTWTARALLLVVAGISTAPLFMPEGFAVAIEHAFSADPQADAGISLVFAAPAPWPTLADELPTTGWKPLRPVPRVDNEDRKDRGRVLLQLPLRVSGLPADSILRSELTSARLIDAAGKTVFQNEVRDLNLRVPGDRSAGVDAMPAWQMLRVPKKTFESIKNQPLRLELDEALILLKPSVHYMLTPDQRQQTLAGIGRCSIGPADTDGTLRLSCTAAAELPSCLGVAPAEDHLAERIACTTASVPLHWQINDLAHEGGSISLRPTGASPSVWNLSAYEPVDRFSRRLTVENVRLADLNVGLPKAEKDSAKEVDVDGP